MTAPRVTADDVGTYWLGPDGGVWRIITYCEYPTVAWERLDEAIGSLHRERRGGAVGSPITEGFQRLLPEAQAATEVDILKEMLSVLKAHPEERGDV